MAEPDRPIVRIEGVTHRYGKTRAVDDVTIELPAGLMVGLLGPDGVGKSTLLGLISGARKLQQGRLEVLGGDMASASHRTAVGPPPHLLGGASDLDQGLCAFSFDPERVEPPTGLTDEHGGFGREQQPGERPGSGLRYGGRGLACRRLQLHPHRDGRG